METGIVSSLNFPSRVARNARWCDSTANWSCCCRVMWNSSTRFSAVSPMIWLQTGSVSPSHRESTITESFKCLPNRRSRETYGAWLMDSVPPATCTSATPACTWSHAPWIAWSPEAQLRWTVKAGTSFGRPARRPMTRATFGASEVWTTQPKMVCSTSAGSSFVRASSSFVTNPPSVAAGNSFRAPPSTPCGVLTPATITVSVAIVHAFRFNVPWSAQNSGHPRDRRGERDIGLLASVLRQDMFHRLHRMHDDVNDLRLDRLHEPAAHAAPPFLPAPRRGRLARGLLGRQLLVAPMDVLGAGEGVDGDHLGDPHAQQDVHRHRVEDPAVNHVAPPHPVRDEDRRDGDGGADGLHDRSLIEHGQLPMGVVAGDDPQGDVQVAESFFPPVAAQEPDHPPARDEPIPGEEHDVGREQLEGLPTPLEGHGHLFQLRGRHAGGPERADQRADRGAGHHVNGGPLPLQHLEDPDMRHPQRRPGAQRQPDADAAYLAGEPPHRLGVPVARVGRHERPAPLNERAVRLRERGVDLVLEQGFQGLCRGGPGRLVDEQS